jgi:hypothetical protein
MAFNLFKNPFENLSLENQSAMVGSLQEIKDYFFKGNTIVQAVLELTAEVKKNIKEQDRLIQVLLKRQEKQMTDKDQKEMVKTMQVFGPAMQRIVGAIKDYSKVPEDAVDKFILSVEKIAAAFEKIKDFGKTIEEAGRGLMMMAGGIILFGLALLISGPLYLLALPLTPIVFAVVLGFLYLYSRILGPEQKSGNLQQGGQGLMYMAAGIFLFGLALYLASFVYQQLWMGTVGVMAILLTIAAVVGIFYLIQKSGIGENAVQSAKALLYMAAVIGLFGLILYLSSLIYAELWTGTVGVLAILLTIAAVVGIFYLIEALGVAKSAMQSAKVLLYMAGVIGLFGLILLLSSLIYAELWTGTIGMLAILLTIAAVVGIFYLIEAMGVAKSALNSARALLYMAAAIGLFGLILYLASFIYAELWMGTVGVMAILLTIAAVIGLFWLMEFMGISDVAMKGAKTLLYMAAVIGLVGLILYLASFIYAELWQGAVGVLAILLVIGALVGIMFVLDMLSDSIYDGVKALAWMTLVLVIVGIALYAISFVYEEMWMGALGSLPILLVIGALVGLMFLLDGLSDTIYDGAKALLAMVFSFGLAAFVLYMISDLADEMMAGLAASWPILILILALVGIMFLLDMLKTNIIMGALSLGVMSLAVLVLAGALYVLKEIEWTPADSLSLAGLLLVLALIGSVLGVLMDVGLLPLLGAAAIAAIGLAIIPLAIGLKYYKEAGWTGDDTINLGLLVGALGLVATVLGNPFTNFMTLLGAAAMVVIGAAIVPLTEGLMNYKNSGWKESDNQKLIDTMTAVVRAFGIMWDEDLQKEAGLKPFSPYEVYMGVTALSGIGNVMTSLAQGLVSFASMQFVEFEVVKDKDGNAVLQPKAVHKLTDADIQAAGTNFAAVLNAILDPIAAVGKKEIEGQGQFAQGYVSNGIRALTGIGNIMTDLAKGIQAFADLKFITYGVVNGGTPDAKLVPTSVVQLTDSHFKAAGEGFAQVVNAILNPIADVGKKESESSGWFSDGYVKKGIAALTGIGNIMTDLAKGIQSFANLEFTTFQVVNEGTADAKIVPKGIVKLGDQDFVNMSSNFDKVLTAFLDPFIRAAFKIKEKEYDINIAMQFLPNITDTVNKIGEAAAKWASEIYDKGVGDKLWNIYSVFDSIIDPVLHEAFKVKDQEFNLKVFLEYYEDILDVISAFGESAKEWGAELTDTGKWMGPWTIWPVLSGMLDPMLTYGQIIKDNSESINAFFDMFTRDPSATDILKQIREEALEWDKFQMPTRPGETFAHFTQSIFDAFRKPDYISIAARYQNFTDNMEVLINGYDKIQKVADSFERIADAFGVMKDHINGMEIERLTQVTNLMGFLDGLANGESDDIVADIGEAITQGMQTLQEILMEIKDQLTPAAAPAAAPGTPGGVGPGTSTGTGAAQPAAGGQNQVLSQVTTALNNLNNTLSRGIKATVASSNSYVPTK